MGSHSTTPKPVMPSTAVSSTGASTAYSSPLKSALPPDSLVVRRSHPTTQAETSAVSRKRPLDNMNSDPPSHQSNGHSASGLTKHHKKVKPLRDRDSGLTRMILPLNCLDAGKFSAEAREANLNAWKIVRLNALEAEGKIIDKVEVMSVFSACFSRNISLTSNSSLSVIIIYKWSG